MTRAAAAMPLICGAVSFLLLLGAGADRLRVGPSSDSIDYNRRVREAAAGFPLQLPGWSGEDAAVEYDAQRMLRPNVMICRNYRQQQSGRQFWFLLVQCNDALSLAGHYPTICYPNTGYTQLSQESHLWHSDSMAVNGSEYLFATNPGDPSSAIRVDSFLLLPDGTSTSDVNAVFIAGSDVKRRFYGGAQVQFVFDSATPREERQNIISQFLSAADNTLAVIASRGSATLAASHAGLN